MRLLDTLLLLADAATLAALVVPSWRGTPWPRRGAVLALLAALAQGLVEGPDWRMVPAYGLTGLLAIVALRHPAWPRWAGKVATVIGLLALVSAAALPLAFPVFQTPAPEGPYAIGTRRHHWTDARRPETFTAEPTDRRELMVQVWYPARRVAGAKQAPYIEDGAALAPLARLLGLPGFIFEHLSSAKTNAVPDAPVADGAERLPVLIFSHGRAGYRQHNTALVEHLVSHGYVVATIDHPYAAGGVLFPDGRIAPLDPRMIDRAFVDQQVPYLAQDVRFTLDQLALLDRRGPLAGRLDMTRVGVMGVSLGGATTAEACRLDSRARACLIIDVWIPDEVLRDGLRQPTLLLTRDLATMRAEGWTEADAIETDREMRALFNRLSGGGYLVRAPGLYHLDFADTALLSPLTGWLGMTGPGDPRRARRMVGDLALAFFDRRLKDAPAPLLDEPGARYPNLLLEKRLPVAPPAPSTPP